MFDVITVPIDESEYADKAIDIAVDFASKYGSKIAAVHVISENSIFTYDDLEDNGDNLLSKITNKIETIYYTHYIFYFTYYIKVLA